MAKLELDKIRQRWEKPRNRQEILRAGLDNERQSFHARLAYDEADSNAYLTEFLRRVKLMLNNTDKYKKFESLMTWPLPSNHLISKASDEWNKILKAQDRVEEYDFVDEELYSDFQTFLDRINFSSVIEQNLFTKVKQAVNTVVIVDIQVLNEKDPLTEPYVYFIETPTCHEIDVDQSGRIKSVMFERGNAYTDDRQLVVIDEESYRVYSIKDNELSEVTDNEHGLGFCPATFAWRDIIDTDIPIRRFNSVSEIVDDLDKYVIANVFKEHIDLYASFPILWKYENGCDLDTLPRDANGNPIKPEVPFLGPGWELGIEFPEGENITMAPPVGFVEPKTQLLEYNKIKIRELEVKIIKHLTGVDNEIQNEKAFNESQIRSQYETRHSVLRYWAENMQFVHTFLIQTIGKLRYGDRFTSATIDYGMDYFLYDAITATDDYEKAKEAGLPQYIVADLRGVVEQIATRNSPRKKARYETLNQLEPYLDVSLANVDKLTPEYELKANFASYIDRFERENGDIATFGSETDFKKKIDSIKKALYCYVEETREFQEKHAPKGADLRQSGQGSGASNPGIVSQ